MLSAGTWADVAFSETGLPAGSEWRVTIGSDVQSSSGTALEIYLPTGSHRCTMSGPAHYLPQPSAGGITLGSSGEGVGVAWQDVQVHSNSASGSVDLGQVVEFSTTLTGTAEDSFVWSGLPNGCSSANFSADSCGPTGAGTFSVVLSVTDANGYTATSAASPITVFSDPSISFIVTPGASTLAGQSLAFTATVRNGSGGFHYLWNGLPAGCQSADSYSLACSPSGPGSWVISITVTDSNGGNATSQGIAVTVQASFLGLPAQEGYGLLVALSVILLAVLAAVFAVRRRRPRKGNLNVNARFTEGAPSTRGPSIPPGYASGAPVSAGAVLIPSWFEEQTSAMDGLDPGSVAMGTPLINPPDPVCWHCHFENSAGSRYCATCAMPLEPPPIPPGT